MTDYVKDINLQHTDCFNFQCNVRQWRHLLSTVTVTFLVLLVVILQGVECSRSVCNIMPQWWHLMVLQYAAASFHLPSVSTVSINTVQYPKPHKQHEVPKITAVLISKVLLPQSNIIAAFVHNHSSLVSDVSSCLPKYKKPQYHKI